MPREAFRARILLNFLQNLQKGQRNVAACTVEILRNMEILMEKT